MKRIIATLFVLAIAAVSISKLSAEEINAYIVPDQLQRLADQQHVASQLGITWEKASPTDVGRYMGTLAASDIIARRIAEKNGRKEPMREDYLSALATVCIWPPNKPPVLTAEDRQALYPAFYSPRVRGNLVNAVGPTAIQLPSLIGGKALPDILAVFQRDVPTKRPDYDAQVLNLDSLKR